MDALPVHEDTGLPFASEVPGAMHACGHDTHVAMLLGAARLLAERRDELAGQVVFMVQPGEEGFHGARYMLEEGLLDVVPEAPVSGAFALHISSTLPSGSVNVRPGPMMAAADQWRMTVRGRGGHASEPHAAADPIPVAAEIVLALQSMVTRRVDVFDPAVVTVAHIEAGSTNNVIPDTAFLEGTIRTLSAERRADVVAAVRAGGHARRRGPRAERGVRARGGLPGDGQRPRRRGRACWTTAAELLGERASRLSPAPLMGAEDFSYVLQRVPGAMALLGACPPGLDPETAPGQPLEPGRLRRGAAAGRRGPLRPDGAAALAGDAAAGDCPTSASSALRLCASGAACTSHRYFSAASRTTAHVALVGERRQVRTTIDSASTWKYRAAPGGCRKPYPSVPSEAIPRDVRRERSGTARIQSDTATTGPVVSCCCS